MPDKNTMSTLKKQWEILKDDKATIKARVTAYGVIDALQKQHEGEEGFSSINLQQTRYKIFESEERANSSQKEAPVQKSSQDVSSKVQASPNKFAELLQNFEFKELTEKEIESSEKKARAIFETKVIVAKVAMEEQFAGLGFDNVQSVGQVTGLVREN